MYNNLSSDMVWWQQTFGPSHFVSQTAVLMNENKVVFILIDKNTAFKHEMREAIIKYYQDNCCSSFKSETFDCAEILSYADDLSTEIIKSFTVGEDPLLLRGETYVDYAVREKLFWDKILWFKGIESEAILAEVTKLSTQYSKKGKKDTGILVIEVPREFASTGYEKFKKIDTANIISETDAETFALNIYRSKNERDGKNVPFILNKYISVLVTCLCGTNAELSEKLIYNEDLTDGNILEVVKCAFNRDYNEKEVKKRIWEAQLKTFFPLVEERRLIFVNKYEIFFRSAMTALDLRDKTTEETISDPYDLEIGQLLYCINKINDSSSVVTKTDSKEIYFLRNVRNALAHLEILDGKTIEELIRITNQSIKEK